MTENAEVEPILPEIKNENTETAVINEETPKKPARSRRPNRNSQRKTRAPRKNNKNNEE